MDDAADCRRRAKEAAAIAKKLTCPHDRALWLEVAKTWLKLAEAAEGTKKTRSPPGPNKAFHINDFPTYGIATTGKPPKEPKRSVGLLGKI